MAESEKAFETQSTRPETLSASKAAPDIVLSAEGISSFNLAMQQNFVPVLAFIRIKKNSNESISPIKLTVSSDPKFFEPTEFVVPSLPPEGRYELPEPPLNVSADFLLSLKERIATTIRVKAISIMPTDTEPGPFADHPVGPDPCEQEIGVWEKTINLLAFNECDGFLSLPELISAYILPNSPGVDQVISKAADCLKSWGEQTVLNGYQSHDSGKVLSMVASIYAAVSSLEINYCVPPASFESGGQKTRFPETIINSRLGTCFDLALFFCGCLEQVGLNSLLILTQTHALVGLWLKNESFPVCFLDDASALRKRVELKEMIVFETTTVTRKNSDFASSMKMGEQKLLAEDFVGFIDIKRCRSAHIFPLPLSFDGQQLTLRPLPAPSGLNSGPKPGALIQPEFVETPAGEKPSENRLDQWKRKLLDLSLRNRLLNFRETAKTIKIVSGSLSRLEDCLADGKDFRIRPLPPDIEAGRSNQEYMTVTGHEILAEFIQREFLQNRLYAASTEAVLEKNLLEVFRDSRNSLQEGGTNTLYLALGFLSWRETKTAETRYAAPIVLVPLEIRRNSVKEGFTICQRDEESQINVTLLELLKQDFHLDIQGLDPLPTDEHGIDLDKTLNTIRRRILDLEGWEVREEAVIGNFQFRKFLMYKDLELRSAKLQENKVVRHLVAGQGIAFPEQGPFPDPRKTDQDFSPDQTFCPVSADSSQLAAVYAAAANRSFVLHGPPGTGKSQTITNIIAHSIASGKSVLFVSEKAAALNVVFSRLSNIGLGPYCLELHSNKSSKAQVLEQLKKALDTPTAGDLPTWQKLASELERIKTDLNSYVDTLHRTQENGFSFYQALAWLAENPSVPERTIPWEAFDHADASRLEAIRECISQISLFGRVCGKWSDSPWKQVRTTEWSPEKNRTVSEILKLLQENGKRLTAAGVEITEKTGSEHFGHSSEAFSRTISLLKSLPELPDGAAAILEAPDWPVTRQTLIQITESGKKRQKIRSELSARFRDEFTTIPLEELRKNWENACASIWPLSWFRKRTQTAFVNSFCQPKQTIAEADMNIVLRALASFQSEQAFLKTMDEAAFRLLGSLWKNGNPDWEILSVCIEHATSLMSEIEALGGTTSEEKTRMKQAISRTCRALSDPLTGSDLRKKLGEWQKLMEDFSDRFQKLQVLLECPSFPGEPQTDRFSFLSGVVKQTALWMNSLEAFRHFCQLNGAAREADKIGLASFIQELRDGTLDYETLDSAFQKSYLSCWAEKTVSSVPVLKDFSGVLHGDRIDKFRRKDEEFLQQSAGAVLAKVVERIPVSTGAVAGNSELGILLREIQKKARHKPLRVLFAEIPTLLPRLKPCLLMSPLSIAQYLSPDHPPFDLVIFDEASQVPVWDAVGAVARGKDLIVVGDPKQLPPTSFFGRSESQEWEESDLTEDMESILDDCIASGMPDMHLNWHYRSLHESLISFSNSCYYDNRLQTFPSASLSSLGTGYRHLATAVYDKGKTRTNQGEAEAVVTEIVRRLRDPELSKFSLGVVTFSSAQQILVEDLLDEARRNDPALEEFFGEKKWEPVFVKNLESVQGDERDVILFSICYGPDAEGRVSMNFGPLNKVGGERRLNVAITRARRELLVITSLKPDMLDLSKTRAVGVKHLKKFLEFVQRGINRVVTQPGEKDISGSVSLEKCVEKALRLSGFEVHSQVGCADYRIDLAIVDPECRDRYLLGIECDGENYRLARSARERDNLRHAVLKKLGWNLHRVWSIDWWYNSPAEVEKIKRALEQCRINQEKVTVLETVSVPGEVHARVSDLVPPVFSDASPKPKPDFPKETPVFTPWTGSGAPFPSGVFDHTSSDQLIIRMIEEITLAEGPVSLPQLSREICSQFSISRATQRIMTKILALANRAKVHIDLRHASPFFWKSREGMLAFTGFRSHTAVNKRKPEDLCPDEIANAAFAVLKTNISMAESDLLKLTAQCFGFSRMGQNVSDAMQTGIQHLCRTQAIEKRDGKIALK